MNSDILAVVGFDPAVTMGLFQPNQYTATVNPGGQKIANSDPQRILIAFFVPDGTAAVAFGVSWGTSVPKGGFTSVIGTTPLVFKYSDYGPIVGLDWYASAQLGVATCGVWELAYRVQTNTGCGKKRNSGSWPTTGFHYRNRRYTKG